MHPHQPARLVGLRELFDVRMLWFSDWYDGPVTGLAMHEGHEYWFVMVANEGGETWDFEPRVHVLHELTPGELATAWEQHRSFSALGIPGCLHEPPCPENTTSGPAELAALYERWPPGSEDAYLDRPAIGWFKASAIA